MGKATNGKEGRACPSGVDDNTTACARSTLTSHGLPDEWAATVEANFILPAQNKTYTIDRRELRRLDMVRIDSHSHTHAVVTIHHYARNTTYHLLRNATYPVGYCESAAMGGRVRARGVGDAGHLRATADFLGFRGRGEEYPSATYHGSACPDCVVRGMPCEKWTHPMAWRNSSYNVSYYFPVVEWRTRQETMHRRLVRIRLSGERATGER
eukprot:gene39132-13609_t